MPQAVRLTLALTACLLAVTAARGAEPVTVGDLAYGEHDAQKLDIHRRPDAKHDPVLIYVHGGGWHRGDKRGIARNAAYFTERGWMLVSVNYRLVPEGRHPANARDVAAAVAWVHDHIAEHGGNPDAIFLSGHSAGCHLAALVATDGRLLARHEKSPALLRGVVALDTAVYDVPAMMARGAPAIYRNAFGDDPAVWKDASPQHHVGPDRDIPPMLVCYSRGGSDDPDLVNPNRRRHAESFAAALREAGVSEATVVDASDRNHAQINHRFGTEDDPKVTGAAMAFLARHLPETRPDPAPAADGGPDAGPPRATEP